MQQIIEARYAAPSTGLRRVQVVTAIASTLLAVGALGYFVRHDVPSVAVSLVPNGDGTLQIRFDKNERVPMIYTASLYIEPNRWEPLWGISSYQVSKADLGSRHDRYSGSLGEYRLHAGDPKDFGYMTRLPKAGEEFWVEVVYASELFGLPAKTGSYRFRLTSDGGVESLGVARGRTFP